DIARRNRAIELARVAGLANRRELLAVELLGDRLGFLLELEVARLELNAPLLELLHVLLGGAQRLVLGQEVIAGIAVLHVDDVTHLAETADTLQQDNLHDGLLLRS